ncbi:MAG TPA: fused MFS/spermidine synthase, partial [Elusimicrobiota bacterium]|nr:fused MFS/spermidine synthase [Elusimicrobiota bacterium]
MKRAPGAAQLVAQSFFLSGLAALVHEVLWARLLALFCGSTSAAVAATTGAVMAGLAAGCALSGRWSRRLPAPSLLSAYAVLEAGVALCSGAGWLLLRAASGVLLGDPARFVAAFAAVLPAATLMGATLPLLTRWSAGSPELSLARLYGVNTTGAVLGCLLCGFVFLPQFGLLRTLALAATFNGCAAFLALMAREEKLGRAPESPGRSRPVPVSLLAAVSLAGAGSLALQAAWTRALCLVLGASVYAFALVLAVFLAGVAGGSLAVHARPRALRASDAFLALAAVSLLGIPLLGEMPYAWARLWSWSSSGPVALHALQALFCLALMGGPTALMGAALPLCAEQAAGGGAPGEDVVGSLWAWNTGGAIVGAVLGGLVFLPALGLLGAIRAGAGLYVLAALASGEPARPAIAGAILAAGLLLPGPDARLLSSGMFVYGPQYQEAKTRRAFLEELRKDRVIFDRDGRSSTVTVLETPQGGRYLRVDGKTDASLSADLDTQLLIGYLPL